jgi:hypothetical protein
MDIIIEIGSLWGQRSTLALGDRWEEGKLAEFRPWMNALKGNQTTTLVVTYKP